MLLRCWYLWDSFLRYMLLRCWDPWDFLTTLQVATLLRSLASPWCKKHHFQHYSCNHSKGVWVKRVRRGRLGVLKVHIGKIDSLWNLAKKNVPGNLQTKAGQNKDVMLYLRCWQWRYECHNGNLLSKTASTLMDRWADEECEKNYAHPRLMHMMFTWIC